MSRIIKINLKLKIFYIFMALSLSFINSVQAAERLELRPGDAVMYGTRSYSGVVMSAYQKAYAMNFEIWKPRNLPAGWYATFDGFPVAQIAQDRWVYGKLETNGAMRPTNLLVGSVIPSNVPGLTPIAATWSYGRYINDPEFLKVKNFPCNRLGWLKIDSNNISTIIAWQAKGISAWVWLGNRWRKFTPMPGEYTWQVLQRSVPYIAEELRKANAVYLWAEPFEVADLTRQWGKIWGGKVALTSFGNQYYTGSGGGNDDSSSGSSLGGMKNDGGTASGGSTPADSGGQWDTQ